MDAARNASSVQQAYHVPHVVVFRVLTASRSSIDRARDMKGVEISIQMTRLFVRCMACFTLGASSVASLDNSKGICVPSPPKQPQSQWQNAPPRIQIFHGRNQFQVKYGASQPRESDFHVQWARDTAPIDFCRDTTRSQPHPACTRPDSLQPNRLSVRLVSVANIDGVRLGTQFCDLTRRARWSRSWSCPDCFWESRGGT